MARRVSRDRLVDVFLDYLGERYEVEEKTGGTQVKIGFGACPFCGEERPDLRIYISTETTQGYCHHCGKGFNAVSFVMAFENCDRARAKQVLYGSASGIVRTFEERPVESPVPWPTLYSVFDFPFAREYLNERNIPDELIERHQMRFCVDNMEVAQSDGSTKLYRTKNRVIVPIFDEFGEPVGWQGRDITGKSKIKYLFPPFFNAGDYLYNYNNFDPELGYAILTEGVMHCFGWERFGIGNSLGSFGKKLSEPRQLDLLLSIRKHIRVLFLAWDSDAAWQKAEFCEKYGHLFTVRIVDLAGRDADEVESKRVLMDALTSARAYRWSDKILARL